LQSFLSEDYEDVAIIRLQERKQGVKKCIQDLLNGIKRYV